LKKKIILFMASLFTVLAAGTAVVCLSGCANLSYYWQSASGHMKVMNAAKPVQDWLSDAQTPQAMRARLALSQRIREFASAELLLPDNASYRRYADLQRRSVVYNVVAAPELSLQLKTWCFAVVGCVSYRGYYDEAQAKALADTLKSEALEVSVYGVPAYSTLGYLNWAGGDPLLNTFITYPEGELARIIFHELSHQVVYVKDDTMFNESFATAVERIGGRLWLARHGSEAAKNEYAEFDARRTQFRALTLRARQRLAEVYKENMPLAGVNIAQLATESVANGNRQQQAKATVMQQLRDEYAQLKASWGGFAGYDAWMARANNASLGALAAYDELAPAFEAVFERQGQDFAKFYDAVKRLAPLTPDARRQKLMEMASG
jgi:predicted aminopeptidase